MPRSPAAWNRVRSHQPQYWWLIGVSLLTVTFLCPSVLTPVAHAQTGMAPPTFSVAHGFFASPFALTLTTTTPGAQIRYTTDFTTPTPSQGLLYTQPIPITGTTVVRAIVYTSSTAYSATVTQTYLFPTQVASQSNQPGAGWPNTFAASNADGGPYPAYYEMAPEIVQHPNNAGRLEAALRGLPAISLVTDLPNLWDENTGIYYNSGQKGQAWERAVSIEWIDPTGATPGFTENAGMRMHGQTSRRPQRTPKRTFRIYFNADYGNTKLEFKLFADNDAVSRFDRILLRGGGNRSWPYYNSDLRREADYINDEFVRRAFLAMGGLAGHGTFAHLYLDGQYWGLYNVAERMDDKFLVSYLGGLETDYDLIAPDEENLYVPGADAGTMEAWNQLQALLNVATVSESLYAQARQRLDVVDLADYMILLHYVANTDWPDHNWYAYRKRVGEDTRFRMLPWDSDTALNQLDIDMTGADVENTPARLFHKLMTNAEFRQLFTDRIYRHLVTPTGQLTPAYCGARYSELATAIDPAIIGESARWGAYARKIYPEIDFTVANNALPAYFHSRDMPTADSDPTDAVPDNKQKNWVQVRDAKLNTYCPQRTAIVLNQYIAKGWYQTNVKPPVFAQDGGAIPAGYSLVLDNTPNTNAGEIYYTVDGSDPRLPGGTVAPTALNGHDAVTVIIDQVTTVKARVLNGSSWSPLHEATFYPPQPFADLVINELHYHPAAPFGVNDDDFEFIELYNKGNTVLRLDNVYFNRGFTYHFPLGASLAPGAYLTLSPNAATFLARYGFAPAATIRGNLSNRGEAIELVDALGTPIDFVDYQDVAPWPITPDGGGPSLSLIHPSLDNSLVSNWAASLTTDGTPGQANGLPLPNQPPAVTITAPSANTTFSQGMTVTVAAQATDSDGTVQQVAFYVNAGLLCTDTSAPYTCQFAPPVGNHMLTAHATDDDGATTISPSVPIVVAPPNQLPVVTITSPVANASFTQGMTVTVEAQAVDSDGAVEQVAIYADDQLICTATTSPYRCQFIPPVGNTLLTARATDDDGMTALSLGVPIVVNGLPNQPPAVTITMPAINATFPQGMTITVTAQASDSDGMVDRVAFYADSVLLCTDTLAPYTCQFTPQAGNHVLTVQATDDDGATTISPAVPIVVNQPLNPSPVVTITTPAANTTLTQGLTVTIAVAVSDVNGVQQVAFYANEAFLCTDTSAPYTCAWTPAVGVYLLKAIATGEGESVVATVENITVQPAGGSGNTAEHLYLPLIRR